MKLYDFPFSPNSRKVRAVAYELGIALETQRVDLLTGGPMPPSPTWIAGYADNAEFYRRMFARWDAAAIRAVPIGVNGGAGCEFHRDGAVRAIEAVEVRDDKILRMHHFMQPAVIALFMNQA